ncbi:hypothetical protein AVEN_37311-1 [Araneus ventricosus]|uniref:Uncharacterized protein n=1 Tax=Araneus ventricosus TaxID=182803 RepID=A0A4Y2S1N2_ARAVE|nr:hypothetical protein AVEN_37311-1 [Araneus ventricosus]
MAKKSEWSDEYQDRLDLPPDRLFYIDDWLWSGGIVNVQKALLHNLDQRPVWCHPINTIHLGGSFTSDPKALSVVSIPVYSRLRNRTTPLPS